jgi:hypothetical protein
MYIDLNSCHHDNKSSFCHAIVHVMLLLSRARLGAFHTQKYILLQNFSCIFTSRAERTNIKIELCMLDVCTLLLKRNINKFYNELFNVCL